MKKITLPFLFIFALNSFTVHAGLKISVMDGDWHTASTWSPAGIPSDEDTLMIDHAITLSADVDLSIQHLIINSSKSLSGTGTFGLHGNLLNNGRFEVNTLGIGDGISTINNGEIVTETLATSNETHTNNGIITSNSIVLGNPLFSNYGTISVTSFYSSDEFHNYFAVYTSGSFTMDGLVYNHAGAAFVLSELVTSGTLTNDGDITASTWVHGDGLANGYNGKFCISDCFTNAATIEGTVDICDATPGGFCDIDAGTVAGSVTFCESSPCQESLSLESATTSLAQIVINAYPNPSHSTLTIEVSELSSYSIQMMSVEGKTVIQLSNLTSPISTVDVSSFAPGNYILVYQSELSFKSIQLTIK